MPTTKNNDKKTSGNTTSKPASSSKKTGSVDSKVSTGSAAVPSARDRVKDIDSKRRSDAESNEL